MPNFSLFVNFPQLFVYFMLKSGPVLKLALYGRFWVGKRGAKFIDAIRPTLLSIICGRLHIAAAVLWNIITDVCCLGHEEGKRGRINKRFEQPDRKKTHFTDQTVTVIIKYTGLIFTKIVNTFITEQT